VVNPAVVESAVVTPAVVKAAKAKDHTSGAQQTAASHRRRDRSLLQNAAPPGLPHQSRHHQTAKQQVKELYPSKSQINHRKRDPRGSADFANAFLL
jgi:hypothetical protein